MSTLTAPPLSPNRDFASLVTTLLDQAIANRKRSETAATETDLPDHLYQVWDEAIGHIEDAERSLKTLYAEMREFA